MTYDRCFIMLFNPKTRKSGYCKITKEDLLAYYVNLDEGTYRLKVKQGKKEFMYDDICISSDRQEDIYENLGIKLRKKMNIQCEILDSNDKVIMEGCSPDMCDLDVVIK